MSHSRRKHPFAGNTTADSEKDYKKFAHRLRRNRWKQRLATDPDDPHDTPDKDIGNDWEGPKDSKSFFDPSEMPHLMRK